MLDLLLQLQLLLHNLLHLNKGMVKLTTNFKIPVPVSAVRQNNNNCVQLYLSPSAEAADVAGCGLSSAERGSSAGQFMCIFLHLTMIMMCIFVII